MKWWGNGVAYSAEVASATKAGLECCKMYPILAITPILQHSSTPALQHSNYQHITYKSICSTNGPGMERSCGPQTFIKGDANSRGKV
jgi:hypothetical protein